MPENPKGILYLVATPIGNLGDFSFRGLEVLKTVDFIACEDTRHSRPLFDRFGIDKPLLSVHEHNEDNVARQLIERLIKGQSMALVSDAGTPLINDPGFPLVREALQQEITVVPIPGACALIAALSASGLSTDRFSFEGFPPRSGTARRSCLQSLLEESRTLVFYESSHRILDFVRDIAQVFPAERPLAVAREVTKLHETFLRCSVGEAVARMESDPYMEKGEFVVLLQGAPAQEKSEGLDAEQKRVLQLLLEECTLKTAVSLTVKITGAKKDRVYQTALQLKRD